MMNGCASYHWLERLIPFPESMKRRPCDEGRWKILKEENTKFNLFELVMDFCGDDIHPCPLLSSYLQLQEKPLRKCEKGKVNKSRMVSGRKFRAPTTLYFPNRDDDDTFNMLIFAKSLLGFCSCLCLHSTRSEYKNDGIQQS